jgi:hypothetical protein
MKRESVRTTVDIPTSMYRQLKLIFYTMPAEVVHFQ